MQNKYIPKRANLQDSKTARCRRPEILADVPGGLRKIVIAEALTALEHQHTIALLSQPHCRNAAAETRTDDDEVEGIAVRAHISSLNLSSVSGLFIIHRIV